MAKRSKSLIFKAREDKARRERLEYERLTLALEEAETEEERDQANEALRIFTKRGKRSRRRSQSSRKLRLQHALRRWKPADQLEDAGSHGVEGWPRHGSLGISNARKR